MGETIVSLLEIVSSSSVVFRSLGRLKMFGEKTWENVQYILVLQSCPDFVVLFFIFTSFKLTPLILFVKIILIRNCKSVKDDKFRWANACVQVG